MNATEVHHVVVAGVDDSPGGRSALRLAAEEAARRGAALCAVCVWSFPGGHTAHARVPGPLRDAVIEEAQAGLACLATDVLGDDPGIPVMLTVADPHLPRDLRPARR